ncbi:MAG: four helix bundle protein [Vicinamibacteria bacterium]
MRQAREATHGLGGLGRGPGVDDDRSGHDHGDGHGPANGAQLDVEKLDCFRVAIEFQRLAADLLPKGCGALRDQLDRASVSIALNLSEGAGVRSPRQKARYYAIARGSASECGAVLAIAAARGLIEGEAFGRARGLVVRLVQMLSRLERRFR